MREKFKRPWIEALRSETYGQGQGVLHTEGTSEFCCLGVLLDVNGIDCSGHPIPEEALPLDITKDLLYEPKDFTFNADSELSAEAKDYFGISQEQHRMLICMNDGMMGVSPKTFMEIADWIEENL